MCCLMDNCLHIILQMIPKKHANYTMAKSTKKVSMKKLQMLFSHKISSHLFDNQIKVTNGPSMSSSSTSEHDTETISEESELESIDAEEEIRKLTQVFYYL